jgi:hypothetical protein
MDRLNEELLASGFFDVPWPQPFFAIGRDPAGNVWFIDTREPALPVYLANHELLSSDSLVDLGCAEAWGDSVDLFLAELRARDAELERETPHAVFAAGSPDSRRRRASRCSMTRSSSRWSRMTPPSSAPRWIYWPRSATPRRRPRCRRCSTRSGQISRREWSSTGLSNRERGGSLPPTIGGAEDQESRGF